MKSSFFKNLGPISFTTIKEHLECLPVNIDEGIFFNDFTSIKNLNKNGLSFLTDTHFSKENIPRSPMLTWYVEGVLIFNSRYLLSNAVNKFWSIKKSFSSLKRLLAETK